VVSSLTMPFMGDEQAIVLEAATPLGFTVRVTRAYWGIISRLKHPVMEGHLEEVRAALETPDEIRLSKSDDEVYLFYKTRRPGRWVCAVSRRTGSDGFLITAYPTDAIKEGEHIWPT
jgi:hypothetical protein